MFNYYCVHLFFIFYLQVKCEEKAIESKNPLPYFRRKVEEITEDVTSQISTSFDTRSNLLSLLFENAKQIYSELDDTDSTEITTTVITSSVPIDTTTEIIVESSTENNVVATNNNVTHHVKVNELHDKPILNIDKFNNTTSIEHLDEMAHFPNITPVNISITDIDATEQTSTSYDLTEKEELMHLSKNLIFFETDRRQRDNSLNYFAHNASYYPSGSDTSLRSCIFCNNVFLENCNNPKNRLIPSTVCNRDDDVCYSQHTPFGVIDRGCFNVNHNLTIYVCSCNLCNYISISEMPYVFTTKRDWVDNVIELSRSRHLRKSVAKDMSCLKCESNASSKTGDMLDTANCLEGNIGSLATEECEENEVCAVKAIKHDGYLWRGCVKEPLFNFWWTYCDSDLCNYDIVTSIYDFD